VGEVHADGGPFAEDGEEVVVLGEEFGADTEGVVGGVSHAEHPLVAANGADGFADLVGEGLEGELVVGGGEGGRDAIGRAVLFLNVEKGVERFFKLACEKVFVSLKWDRAGGLGGKFFGEVKAVDCLQKKEGADPVVEIVGLATEGIELLALGEKGGGIEGCAGFGEGAVASGGVFCGDQGNEHG